MKIWKSLAAVFPHQLADAQIGGLGDRRLHRTPASAPAGVWHLWPRQKLIPLLAFSSSSALFPVAVNLGNHHKLVRAGLPLVFIAVWSHAAELDRASPAASPGASPAASPAALVPVPTEVVSGIFQLNQGYSE